MARGWRLNGWAEEGLVRVRMVKRVFMTGCIALRWNGMACRVIICGLVCGMGRGEKDLWMLQSFTEIVKGSRKSGAHVYASVEYTYSISFSLRSLRMN